MRRRSIPPTAVLVLLAGKAWGGALDDPFPAVIELSSLLPANGGDGSVGFVLNGIDESDRSGRSVSSAGDVNGDGIEDLIIGADLADPDARSGAGESYVVFGGPGPGAGGALELSSLDGANGFVINGIDAGDRSGRAVAGAGDVNGDEIDDLIIGAYNANTSGEAYVVFGGVGIGAGGSLELSSLDGSNGFVLHAAEFDSKCGYAVSGVGDVNGDGVDDLIIGAHYAEPGGQPYEGETYVVFGAPDLGASGSFDLASLDGVNGFEFIGVDDHDYCGFSVSSAGDVNGDGVIDLVMGALYASNTGQCYIVFGGPSVGASVSMDRGDLDGANGFIIDGFTLADRLGNSVASAGDINGDGVDDLVAGSPHRDPGGVGNAGEAYVIFGKDTAVAGAFPETFELSTIDGTNGFVMTGLNDNDNCGAAVSGAGDINGDGADDFFIGAHGAQSNAGECYVVFGGPGVGASGAVDLSSLDGANGFVIEGIDASDFSGFSVSCAGDVNADGNVDLIIGAPLADPNGNGSAGESYVIFGRDLTPTLCVGDANGDGTINFGDVTSVLGHWLADYQPGTGPGDANGDGLVDFGDVTDVLGHWLEDCP